MARVRIEQQQHPSPAVASTKLSENHTEIHRAAGSSRAGLDGLVWRLSARIRARSELGLPMLQ